MNVFILNPMTMKRLLLLLILLFSVFTYSQVGIGTTSPEISTMLEVKSTSKGFLPPRMTRVQRNAIVSPVAGLQVWCSDCGTFGELQIYNSVNWTNMIGGAASGDSVPGSPTSLVVTPGNTQVSVSFTAPASNGGNTITGYTVTSFPGGFTSTGTTSPRVVAGLTNGTLYNFTVFATNAMGNSAPSSPSADAVPCTIPSAPTSPVATVGNAQASVAFVSPASNGGGVITSYTVTSSPGGLFATASSSPIVVSSLINGTPYTFTVLATNAAGNSVASTATSSVTPFTIPSAPTSLVATAGNAQASVSFTTPGSSGGSSISSYTITSTPGNFTATGTSSPIVVGGLTNGTVYSFTAVATNAAGNSVASVASNSVTPLFVCGSSVTFTYNGVSVTYGSVSRAYGGSVGTKCWLDRNLGATEVATSNNYAASYGDLFQWGRGADGHQNIVWTSSTTSNGAEQNNQTSSTTNLTTPPTTAFIKGSTNWYTGSNPDNLWQGTNNVNNPCPSGFRLPTQEEWEAERLIWSSNNLNGAFNSPLKLPVAGLRGSVDGLLYSVGITGYYWSSFISVTSSRYIVFNSSTAVMDTAHRASGMPVRCIRN